MGDGHSRTSVRLSPGGIERELKDFELCAVTWEEINLTDFRSATSYNFPRKFFSTCRMAFSFRLYHRHCPSFVASTNPAFVRMAM